VGVQEEKCRGAGRRSQGYFERHCFLGTFSDPHAF